MGLTPLRVWAVSDGRAGIENQVLGLAEAVARRTPVTIEVKRLTYRSAVGRWSAAFGVAAAGALVEPLHPPWPDLWIAAGRATLPYSVGVRRWSAGRTFTVQLQDPRRPAHLFDLVIPPEHDGLSGSNVISILGSPHRVTPERLAEAAAACAGRFNALPRPHVAVLVGGRSKVFRFPVEEALSLGRQVAAAVRAQGGSMLATFSRRTPDDARAAFAAASAGLRGGVGDGTGPNPYFAYLATADLILVTEDSTNMAVEAAATGKPVLVLPMPGGSPKFDRLHASLRARGVERPFTGGLERWTYGPLRETERAAEAVLSRLASLIVAKGVS